VRSSAFDVELSSAAAGGHAFVGVVHRRDENRYARVTLEVPDPASADHSVHEKVFATDVNPRRRNGCASVASRRRDVREVRLTCESVDVVEMKTFHYCGSSNGARGKPNECSRMADIMHNTVGRQRPEWSLRNKRLARAGFEARAPAAHTLPAVPSATYEPAPVVVGRVSPSQKVLLRTPWRQARGAAQTRATCLEIVVAVVMELNESRVATTARCKLHARELPNLRAREPRGSEPDWRGAYRRPR
jgi:hypothetical protein